MKLRSTINQTQVGWVALALAFVGMAFGQGITTSGMNGTVTDQRGGPIAGATVTILHEPSGTRAIATSRSNGQFNISGLRIGGPYTVTAAGSAGAQPVTRRDLYLELGQTLDVSLALSTEIVQMEAFRIQGDRDTTFDTGRMGTSTSFSDEEILNTASVRSDIQDIARLDSRLMLTSLDIGGQLSAQGQNFRFNSFLIDGVEANDSFGLNSNGVSTLRGPIMLEALQAVDIELNPYDVRRAGFIGVLINAVTKSGSNQFSGSAQYEYSDKDMRAKNPRTGVKEPFEENRYTFTFGGPILKDRLFFFLSYDDFQRVTAAPSAGFIFTAASLALIDQVIAKAKTFGGYDPGTFSADTSFGRQETYLGKLDWNISEQHRLALSFRDVQGYIPIFSGVTSFSGSSLSSQWYDRPQNTKTYTAQAFSQWTPDFRTEASYSYSTYNSVPQMRSGPFPAIGIGGLLGTRTDSGATVQGFLNFGTPFSQQLNYLDTQETLMKLSGEYSIGNHTIVIGGELNQTVYDDRFLQGYFGSYTFNPSSAFGTNPARSGVENFLLGRPTSYTDAQPLPGYTIEQVFAKWTYKGYAALIQDTWRPNNRLTMVGGLRLDYPTVSAKPPFNQNFFNAFGIRNDVTNDGDYTVAPRVGFNYRLPTDRKTEVRGGVGLFQGKNPAVWLANAYQNAGTASAITVNVNGNNQPTLQFEPDVTKQPIPAGTAPVPTINVTEAGFKQPSSWKGNLAFDHQLPFGGLIFTGEFTATKVNQGLMVEFLNFLPATSGPATMPDGRIRYAGNITPGYMTVASPDNVNNFPQINTAGRRRITSFADVYRIRNVSKGQSNDITLSLGRPMKNRWAAGVAWTRGRATEVSPLTSSTAGSLYTTRAVFNPNVEVASTSNTEVKDKIVAGYTREFQFFKNYKTTVSAVYEGHTGHVYSWVFSGDANGDGITGNNDLFYMPTGPSDPKVSWVKAEERDAFFAFANANGLSRYAGQVVPRNSETSPWKQTVDLTVTQRIPLSGKVRAEVYLQMVNFANLLDDSWGLLEEVPFNYKRTVAGTIYNPAGNGGQGQYSYLFNNNTLDPIPTTINETQASRWQAKIGMRVSF